MAARPSVPMVAAAIAFFSSGFAALVYQVAWQRILALETGVGIYSIALIVAAFLAGLGVGSELGGRLSVRLDNRAALRAFAATPAHRVARSGDRGQPRPRAPRRVQRAVTAVGPSKMTPMFARELVNARLMCKFGRPWTSESCSPTIATARR